MKPAILTSAFIALALTAHAADSPEPAIAAEPELRNELLRRTGPDQDVRFAIMRWMNENGANGKVDVANLSDKQKTEYEELSAKIREIDKSNTAWLKTVIEKHGWPTIGLLGNDGANAAWLLVQHADGDRAFQRQCLGLMAALPKDAVSQSDFAYLTDRVLLAEGKKQLYGTQLDVVDGKLKPCPLEDEANVDQRRSEVGLQPLAEYLAFAEQHLFGSPAAK